jgi:hypothetical protein
MRYALPIAVTVFIALTALCRCTTNVYAPVTVKTDVCVDVRAEVVGILRRTSVGEPSQKVLQCAHDAVAGAVLLDGGALDIRVAGQSVATASVCAHRTILQRLRDALERRLHHTPTPRDGGTCDGGRP